MARLAAAAVCMLCARVMGREPGGNVGMGDLVDPHRVQRTEIRTGQVEPGDLERRRPQRALLVREIDVDDLGEGAFGRGPLRRLLVLRILPERDPGKDLACTLPRLRRREAIRGADSDAPGAPAGAVLGDVGAALPLAAQPEARELGIPGESLALRASAWGRRGPWYRVSASWLTPT